MGSRAHGLHAAAEPRQPEPASRGGSASRGVQQGRRGTGTTGRGFAAAVAHRELLGNGRRQRPRFDKA
ncbi:hypothetical protein PR202_ga05256 [Eleusine coracana subsp. coracana]|uniref:Uncharacterized protein n=1 Tax=Eleusine coracana subsp. coracana TaxID=191504 RepID=A0AAV5BRY2_ELECO|nr:hypothetical protein PR202_ga04802 [Eleusine coracana subsp. coracana]GJM89108.1 hypothetical protein PR202_ga05256 [Eleusine coracana subsp. coracana]